MLRVLLTVAVLSLTLGEAAASGLFRAVLVIYVTSETRPMGMIMGHYPQVYVGRETCEEFAKKINKTIAGSVEDLYASKMPDVEVLHAEVSCSAMSGGHDT